MSSKDRLKAHLLLDFILRHHPGLLKELMVKPRSVLERLGVDEEALRCPEEAHEAYERGKKIAKRAEALRDRQPMNDIPRIAEIARKNLGNDYEIDKVPFGLRFRERIPDTEKMDWTATATFECVFGPGCHGDVDG